MLSEGEKIINSKQGGLINEGKRINSSLQLISGDFYIQSENNIPFIKSVTKQGHSYKNSFNFYITQAFL